MVQRARSLLPCLLVVLKNLCVVQVFFVRKASLEMCTFIITTSLLLQPPLLEEVEEEFREDVEVTRVAQYMKAIPIVLDFAKKIGARVLLVENNGPRPTVFDSLDCEVLYTDTNKYTIAKGTNELLNVLSCLYHFQVPDEELVIKITGRYVIDVSGSFCQYLQHCNPNDVDCIIRYGSFADSSNEAPHEDCITGLIAMKCKYIKQMQHTPGDIVEHSWAKQSLRLDPKRIIRISGKVGFRMYSWHTKEVTYRDL